MADPVTNLINKIYAEQGKSKYFDAALGAAIENARYRLADLNRSYGSGVNEARIGYDEAARNLLKQRDEAYDQNSGQFAGQGILRSGIFATEQGKVGEAYQRSLTDAAQRRTQALQNLANSRLSGYNSIQGGLRTAQGAAITRAEQKRQQQAQQRIQAEYQAQQNRLAMQALQMQQQQMRQQIAMANRSGGGGGGGGGGGYYSMEDLFPGMFGAPPARPPSPPLKQYSPKQGKTGARVRVM